VPVRKTDFSKVLVLFIIIANVLFTAAVLWVFLQTGSEPAALVAAWFAFTTGELWLLAGIKKEKLKGESKDD
jgi:hypothetical protein